MSVTSLTGLFVISAVAFLVPLALGFTSTKRVPVVVVEIVAGIVIGPSTLGWVKIDVPVHILSQLGLAFLLFNAGMEIELHHIKRSALALVTLGFLLTLGLAIPVGLVFYQAGQVKSPLFLTIVLSATTLGMVMPLLKDAGEHETAFGQLLITGAVIADFVPIVLLSLFFFHESTNMGTKLILLVGFVLLAVALAIGSFGLERWKRLAQVLVKLQDSTAQIRIRSSFMLLMGFAALAEITGLEVILGAFLAGAILKLIDTEQAFSHPHFRKKLEAVGFGIFIPIFFVSTGVGFNLRALFASPAALGWMLLFLLSLLLVRGIPALLYRRSIGNRRTLVAGLLHATSLPFIVTGANVGMQLGIINPATAAALVATGLLSTLLFPMAAISLLRISTPATVLMDEPA